VIASVEANLPVASLPAMIPSWQDWQKRVVAEPFTGPTSVDVISLVVVGISDQVVGRFWKPLPPALWQSEQVVSPSAVAGKKSCWEKLVWALPGTGSILSRITSTAPGIAFLGVTRGDNILASAIIIFNPFRFCGIHNNEIRGLMTGLVCILSSLFTIFFSRIL
jgi:hypothetical protein